MSKKDIFNYNIEPQHRIGVIISIIIFSLLAGGVGIASLMLGIFYWYNLDLATSITIYIISGISILVSVLNPILTIIFVRRYPKNPKMARLFLKRHVFVSREEKNEEKAYTLLDDIVNAHQHSSLHRDKLLNDFICGCFYCIAIFSPLEIKEWCDKGNTAICLYCGIDSVIGESSGFPITKEFLTKMHKHWF